MTLRAATEYTRVRRPYINPNPGFLLQLGKHEVRTRCVWPAYPRSRNALMGQTKSESVCACIWPMFGRALSNFLSAPICFGADGDPRHNDDPLPP